MTDVSRPCSLWHNLDYMLLWSGQLASVSGSAISGIAFPLFVLGLTHSPVQAGIVGALGAVPYLLLGLPAGAFVDRWNRKKTMIICDAGRAISLGSIPLMLWLGHVSIVQLYIVAFVSGTLFVFFNVAEGASLPRVVPQEQLAAAISQNQGGLFLAGLLGPSIGGLLFQVNRVVPFAIDAVSYAASVFTLAAIRTEFQEERHTQPGNLIEGIREGLVWLWHQELVRFFTFLAASLNFVGGGAGLILIVLARSQQASSVEIGLMFSLSGVGGLVGSIIAPRVEKRFTFGQVTVGMLWMMALLWPLYLIAPNPLALGAVSLGINIFPPIGNAVQNSYRLALTPDAMQGRVGGAISTLTAGINPFGQVVTGALLQSIGPRPTIVIFMVWLIIPAASAVISSHVRHAPRLTRA